MERIDEIITSAKGVVDSIYEKINEIETCKTLLENLKDAKLHLIMPDNMIASLHPAITDEQEQKILLDIIKTVEGNMTSASNSLKRFSLDDVLEEKEEPIPVVTIEPEILEERKKPEQEDKKPEQKPEQKRETLSDKIDEEELKQMLRDGYSVRDITKHYGFKSDCTVYNYIEKHKINKERLSAGNKRPLTDDDIPHIRAIYTNGPLDLTETAADLGTSKKILYEFVHKKHLEKVMH